MRYWIIWAIGLILGLLLMVMICHKESDKQPASSISPGYHVTLYSGGRNVREWTNVKEWAIKDRCDCIAMDDKGAVICGIFVVEPEKQ